jgi:hypothetical protein
MSVIEADVRVFLELGFRVGVQSILWFRGSLFNTSGRGAIDEKLYFTVEGFNTLFTIKKYIN